MPNLSGPKISLGVPSLLSIRLTTYGRYLIPPLATSLSITAICSGVAKVKD